MEGECGFDEITKHVQLFGLTTRQKAHGEGAVAIAYALPAACSFSL